MDPEQAWRSGKMRAWGVGVAFAVLGGIISAVSGMFAGLCCLFQFANILVPALAGLLAGLIGSGVAPWPEMGEEAGAGAGAGLGFRSGFLAAVGSATLGFIFTMLWPVVSIIITAFGSDDIASAVIGGITVLLVSGLMALLFTVGGGVLGALLGVGTGAIMGAMRGGG